ncbi:MAG: hypothetical protein YHS30scaffold324_16 [Catenulispora phage 69_17]|jgi:hypothetical protein|nr:MAG: hypothetical protein YHS30scaffold324_16 [Catenulispora phage 69_17]
MSHVSSNDDEISPAVKPLIDYLIWADGVMMPMRIQCDDIAEKDGYVRFMQGDVPNAVIPVGRLAAVHRVAPKEPAQ